jgi:hypothetical protein
MDRLDIPICPGEIDLESNLPGYSGNLSKNLRPIQQIPGHGNAIREPQFSDEVSISNRLMTMN